MTKAYFKDFKGEKQEQFDFDDEYMTLEKIVQNKRIVRFDRLEVMIMNELLRRGMEIMTMKRNKLRGYDHYRVLSIVNYADIGYTSIILEEVSN